MKRRLKHRLQERLKRGFWFHWFQELLEKLQIKCSLLEMFYNYLRRDGEAPLGAAELYQVLLIGIGALWVTILYIPPPTFLSSWPIRAIGFVAALYFITELLVFSLNWIFVAEKPLESYNRSLATFLLSIPFVGIAFTILYSLTGCIDLNHYPWERFHSVLVSTIRLDLLKAPPNIGCQIISHYHLFVSATILLIILGSLVGAVIRSDKKNKQ